MSDLFSLKGKVALVTGASSGLGVQFAQALGRQGAKVCVAARRVEKLEAVVKENYKKKRLMLLLLNVMY